MPDVPVDLPIEQRIAQAVAELGEPTVVLRALSLIAGNNEGEEFLLVVGGEHARGILDGAPVLYWPELWGTRALLYVWNDSAVIAVTA
ncbi:MAG TPA: HEAT repeat domain-containing protein, partial [Rhodoglobus sp.]|nr:HEAT repeat domain-containing protein [Rhodoglobus sp.]HQG69989.1 HEAT repeat domain-containing protein [Rhodoglobus sp.]